ncbi:MAG: ASPIC/UnbV domain-containing protein [Verrucomicrobiales bacterium]
MPQTFNTLNDNRKANELPHTQLSKMIESGRSFSGNERNCVFINTGKSIKSGGKFADISFSSGLDYEDDGRSVVPVDWDHDGDMDIFISNRNAPRIRYLRNESNNPNSSIQLKLLGNGISSNKDAIGARVEIKINGQTLVQTLRAGEGFLSQSSQYLHFGTGNNKGPFDVSVNWPDKTNSSENFTGISPGRRYLLKQGKGISAEIKTRPTIKTLNPSNPDIPPPERTTRSPITPLLSGTELKIKGANNKTISTGSGTSSLILIWASWCPSCREELQELTNREKDIRKAGLQIIALNVDTLGDGKVKQGAEKEILKNMNFPFASSVANAEVLQSLQEMHDVHIGLSRPLPIPSAFLLDPKGRVSVIYKGKQQLDTIIADLEHANLTRAERSIRSAAIKGRAINHPVSIASGDLQAASLQFRRAASEEKKGNIEAAESHYLWATELVPNYSAAQISLGKLYLKKREWKSAAERIWKGLQHDRGKAEDHYILAKTYQQIGKNNEVLKSLGTAIELDPEFAPALFEIAAINVKSGNIPNALLLYRQGLKTQPDNLKAANNLAWLLATCQDAKVRNPKEALLIAQKIVRATKEQNSDALDTLAAAQAACGDFESAIKTVNKAILLIKTGQLPALTNQLKARLDSYQNRKPHIE